MNNPTDLHRSKRGFLTSLETSTTIAQNNILLDPQSVLIGKKVTVGTDNVFYPGVVIEQQDQGIIEIGNNNIFYPGTYIVCSAGHITIGDYNDLGPAGLTVRANQPNSHIKIGNHGRYCDGPSIMGQTSLGNGSQVLGNITVQGCTLASGGTFQEPEPDQRAAVLKGFGLARGITLKTGEVINGSGDFSKAAIELQSTYHPKHK